MSVIHLSKKDWSGGDPACGTNGDYENETVSFRDLEDVDCKNCLRTKAYRSALASKRLYDATYEIIKDLP